MCGIILAGGNMYSGDVDLFEKLMYHDIERGKDSTGVMTYRGGATDVCKFALPSDVFIRYPGDKDAEGKIVVPGWAAFRNKQVKYSEKSTVMSTQFGSVYVGHNRAATAGKVCDANAHPFQYGHITLVHNGTLRNQSLLPEHEKFAVDSENIAYSMFKIGVDETIQKLHGAFTLVWINSKDETLHIIRNSERPFHLLEKTCGDWFGASEEDMLMWVLTRQKSFSKATIKRHFECKVGVEYIFNISGKKMVLKEEKEHKLPTFHTTYSYSSGRSYDRWDSQWDNYTESQRNKTSTSASQAAAQALGKEKEAVKPTYTAAGINNFLTKEGYRFRLDQRVPFFFSDFRPYPSRVDNGVIRGFGYDGNSYYQVVCHNATRVVAEALEKAKAENREVTAYGTLRSASLLNGIVTLALMHLTYSFAPGNPDGKKPETNIVNLPAIVNNKTFAEAKQMYDGKEISYAVWAEKAQKQNYKCPICDEYLMWTDIGDQKINHAGQLVHFDCARYESVMKEDNELDEEVNGNTLPIQFMTARMVDGSTITRENFNIQMKVQGGCCPYCNDPIDWDEIECCQYYTDGRTIMHEGCQDLDQYDPAIKEVLAELDSLIANHDDDSNFQPDTFFCDICREFVPAKEVDTEASAAIGTDVCKDCASLHKLPSAAPKKGLWSYTGTGKKTLKNFTEEEFKQQFVQALGSDKVSWEEIDHPDVKIEQLGTKQYRYYRRPKTHPVVTKLCKTLSNGKTVNKAIWMKINCCFSCHQIIPWAEAESAQFAGNTGRLYCEKCYSKVGLK